MFLHRLGKVRAPEFPSKLTWLQSDPLSMKRLSGKVVLLDFWTLSCVNCLRTIPRVNEWHQKYADKGLVVIGVHTPEFSFEQDQSTVEAAIERLGISYPVVLDPDYKIWHLYANRWWPRKFLIDAKGVIVYDHVGEGGYAETEQAIQKALMANGQNHLPAVSSDESIGGGICYRMTPELYLGFLRGRVGNSDRFVPNNESVFEDVGEKEEDVAYLHGHWEMAGESIRHTRALAVPNEFVAVRYSAFSVNVVARPILSGRKKQSQFIVELDGQPLPEDMAGDDVVFKDGVAVVQVKEARMYNLIDSGTYHHGTLKIKTASDNLELFAFTFQGCRDL